MNSASDNIFSRIETYLLQQKELYGSFDVETSLVQMSRNDISLDKIQPSVNVIGAQLPSVNLDKTDSQDNNAIDSQSNTSVPVNALNMTDILIRDPKLNEIYNLDELHAYCATLDLLKTDLPDTRMVFGKGNPQADLLLIGEAPGAEEDRLGEPFVGRSGQLLTKILQSINFSRDDIYIANILKHRPPDNRNPLPEERDRSLPYLLKQIDLISPKLILCLGKVPTETLLQTKGSLTSLRGIFHSFWDRYEVLLTYHPAYLLRDPNKKRDTWEDVKLLRKRYDELGCKP
jgi:uracil-DNA glycosylase